MLRRYPAAFALIFVVAGILTADTVRLSAWIFFVFSLAALLPALLLVRSRYRDLASVLFGIVLFGFAAFHFAAVFYSLGPRHVSHVVDSPDRFRIRGRVSDWPVRKPDRTEIPLAVDSLGVDFLVPAEGSILLKLADTAAAVQYGDRLEFHARIRSVPGGGELDPFDYRRYLALRGIHGIVYLPTSGGIRVDFASSRSLTEIVDRVRVAIISTFHRRLGPEAAALAAGFLIGETRHIPDEIYRWFRDSGTLHLLAVSGSNVALVIAFFILLLRPFGLDRRVRAIVLMLIVFFFTLLSCEEPSVVRAAVMAALVLLAGLVQRRIDLNNIITLAAFLILLAAPTQLFDIGFQLSFVTAGGLIFLTPRVARFFKPWHNRRWYRWLVLPLVIVLIAQLASAPLVALYFGRLPLLAVPANLVIVPLVSIAVIGSMVLLAAEILLPLLAMLVAALVDPLLRLILHLLAVFSDKSIPVLQVDAFTAPVALGFYALLGLAAFAVTSLKARRAGVIGLLLFVNAALGVELFAATRPDDGRDIWLTSVPGGVAAVVEAPGGDADLILTGLRSRSYPLDERIFLPALNELGVSRLNRCFLLSADYDALDDFLRLAAETDAAALYVPASLTASLSDLTRLHPNLVPPARLVPFSGMPAAPPDSGISVAAGRVRLSFAAGEMLFLGRGSRVPAASAGRAGCRWLIVGGPVSDMASAADIARRGGFDRIVCAKIAQHPVTQARSRPRRPARPAILDLSRTGDLLVRAGDGPRERLKIVGPD